MRGRFCLQVFLNQNEAVASIHVAGPVAWSFTDHAISAALVAFQQVRPPVKNSAFHYPATMMTAKILSCQKHLLSDSIASFRRIDNQKSQVASAASKNLRVDQGNQFSCLFKQQKVTFLHEVADLFKVGPVLQQKGILIGKGAIDQCDYAMKILCCGDA